ncbi:MAG: GNAT family N-acetyltransferase [Planctomycetes bacterium]|nr:GNAT family N-acetyltransferase [Planctomycetota bacterium]MCP4772014.1 GNAT family N-acetyltransferase [Planctomycetota bacterium]MCP4860246.1 GNAT family N-acetyltransferase [Planctomycetota bacterium]
MPDIEISPLDPNRKDHVELVAERMRETLIEVLGEERGRGMYSMSWLRDRVMWHMDPRACTGQVILAKDRHPEDLPEGGGDIFGHTIVHVEQDANGQRYGLFSTTFVIPLLRRIGLASRLLDVGEKWMLEQGLDRAVTDTSKTNSRLIQLFEERGYEVELKTEEMLRLGKKIG